MKTDTQSPVNVSHTDGPDVLSGHTVLTVFSKCYGIFCYGHFCRAPGYIQRGNAFYRIIFVAIYYLRRRADRRNTRLNARSFSEECVSWSPKVPECAYLQPLQTGRWAGLHRNGVLTAH